MALFVVWDPRLGAWVKLALGVPVAVAALCGLAALLWMLGVLGLLLYWRAVRHEAVPEPAWPWFVRIGYWALAGWLLGELLGG